MTATATRAARSWTPAQAGYQPRTQVVTSTRPDTPEAPGLVQHYVLTRHGIVARTWCGPDLVEVALRRRGQVRGTYQGHITAVPGGGWQAYDTNRTLLGPGYANYLDAEAPLLRRRTGVTTTGTYRWPFAMRVVLDREISRAGW